MKQPLLFIFLLSAIFTSKAQQGDFISIKKNGHSFKTFFKDSHVTFLVNTGEWFDGKLIDIRNDTLFLRQVIVRQVQTQWGVPRIDTMTNFIRKIYYRDIFAIPRKHESFSYIKDGTLLMIGGAGYILLNVVNSAYLHYDVFGSKNLPGILSAASVFGAGLFLKKLRKSYIVIKQKYTIEYIKM